MYMHLIRLDYKYWYFLMLVFSTSVLLKMDIFHALSLFLSLQSLVLILKLQINKYLLFEFIIYQSDLEK